MTPQKVKYYRQAMDRIIAKERLLMMDATQYPTLQQKDKRKRHKEVYKAAYPENFNTNIVKTSDLELI